MMDEWVLAQFGIGSALVSFLGNHSGKSHLSKLLSRLVLCCMLTNGATDVCLIRRALGIVTPNTHQGTDLLENGTSLTKQKTQVCVGIRWTATTWCTHKKQLRAVLFYSDNEATVSVWDLGVGLKNWSTNYQKLEVSSDCKIEPTASKGRDPREGFRKPPGSTPMGLSSAVIAVVSSGHPFLGHAP